MATSIAIRRHGLLTIRIEQDVDSLVLHAAGELDIATGPALEDALLHALEGGAPSVVLDLDELEFIDSAGLRILCWGSRVSSEDGDRLRIRCAGSRVRRTIELCGMESVMPLVA